MKKSILSFFLLFWGLSSNAQSVSLNLNTSPSPACPGTLTDYYSATYTSGAGNCGGSLPYYFKYTVSGGTINNQTVYSTTSGTTWVNSQFVVWDIGNSCQSNGSLKVEVIVEATGQICAQATVSRTIAGDWSGGVSGNNNIMTYGNYTYSVPLACGATSYSWSYPPSWSVVGSATGSSITFSIQAGDSPGSVTCTPNTLSTICPASKSYYVNFSECLGKLQGQYDGTKVTGRVVSGDFDNDGSLDDIAAMYDYGATNASMHVWLNGSTQMAFQGSSGWWSSNSYDAAKVMGFVSGDFDNDGFIDDVASIYYYGNNSIATHVFLGNTSSFSTSTWYNNSTYDGSKIQHRVVSGDFDSDGFLDDITAFYDYGNNTTSAHVWKGQANGFAGPTTAGWWSSSTYNVQKITGRVVSGDFDGDGYYDDITAFYDYGNTTTTAHVWRGQVINFTGPTTAGWWSGSSYDALKITGRVVSGDFDQDGVFDDVAAVYDYGNTTSTLHVWKGQTTGFASPVTAGWWSSTSYDANKLTYRMVSGSFTSLPPKKRQRYAIAGMYDYTCLTVAMHVWVSTVTAFSYQGDDGRWMICDDCDGAGRLANPELSSNELATEPVKDMFLNTIVNLYPNPTAGVFTIQLQNTSEVLPVNIVLIDLSGRVLENYALSGAESGIDVDISSYSAGVYFIVVERMGNRETHKLILQY